MRSVDSDENTDGKALTAANLGEVDVVVDFTTPQAVLRNIAACVEARTSMVVGTTGWYGELPRIKMLVEQSGTGVLFASNFSIGVNLFFEIVRAAAPAVSTATRDASWKSITSIRRTRRRARQ